MQLSKHVAGIQQTLQRRKLLKIFHNYSLKAEIEFNKKFVFLFSQRNVFASFRDGEVLKFCCANEGVSAKDCS